LGHGRVAIAGQLNFEVVVELAQPGKVVAPDGAQEEPFAFQHVKPGPAT